MERRPPAASPACPSQAPRWDPSIAALTGRIEVRFADQTLVTQAINGEVIIRRNSPARSVFFMASGAVELATAGQTWRLGRGEMFGQLAILMKKARRAEDAPSHPRRCWCSTRTDPAGR